METNDATKMADKEDKEDIKPQANMADIGGQQKQDVSMTRMWISCLLVMVAAITGTGGAASLRVQYLNYRIGVDDYNYTPSAVDSTNSSTDSTNDAEISLQIQATVSYIVIFLALATDIPAIVTCLLVGSYSDFLGRKPLLTAAVFGCFCRAGSIAIVTVFNINVEYLYLGAFIDGLTGSLFTLSLAMTATIADLTPVLSQRATRFSILQSSILVSSALSLFTVGYLIGVYGYAVCACVMTGLCFFALLVTLFAVPETLVPVNRKRIDWNPLSHLKKTVSFFFSKSHGNRRGMYIAGLFAYLLMRVVNSGRISVEILYFLAPPISWDSVHIGIYCAVVLIVWSFFATLCLRVLAERLSLETTGILASISMSASLIVESLARSGSYIYISAAAGFLCAATFVIPKAMLSRITSPAEQGALLSSLAFIDAASDMFSSSLSAFIYERTLEVFKGAVFVFLAVVSFVILLLYGFFWYLRRRLDTANGTETSNPPGTDEKPSSANTEDVELSVKTRF